MVSHDLSPLQLVAMSLLVTVMPKILGVSYGAWAIVVGSTCLVAWLVGAVAVHRTRKKLGPKLHEWLGEEPQTWDFWEWYKARAVGLTVAEAQRWSDHGVPYATAARACRRHVPIEDVLRVGDALQRAGLCDVTTRRIYNYCVASQTKHFDDALPQTVIHRWARFNTQQIEVATARRMADPDVEVRRQDSIDPGDPIWRSTGYAREILLDLEGAR